ncbi:MAG: hypothetical protein ACREN8_12390, partial [Candidatus Dormibacteraceae bacterium]
MPEASTDTKHIELLYGLDQGCIAGILDLDILGEAENFSPIHNLEDALRRAQELANSADAENTHPFLIAETRSLAAYLAVYAGCEVPYDEFIEQVLGTLPKVPDQDTIHDQWTRVKRAFEKASRAKFTAENVAEWKAKNPMESDVEVTVDRAHKFLVRPLYSQLGWNPQGEPPEIEVVNATGKAWVGWTDTVASAEGPNGRKVRIRINRAPTYPPYQGVINTTVLHEETHRIQLEARMQAMMRARGDGLWLPRSSLLTRLASPTQPLWEGMATTIFRFMDEGLFTPAETYRNEARILTVLLDGRRIIEPSQHPHLENRDELLKTRVQKWNQL